MERRSTFRVIIMMVGFATVIHLVARLLFVSGVLAHEIEGQRSFLGMDMTSGWIPLTMLHAFATFGVVALVIVVSAIVDAYRFLKQGEAALEDSVVRSVSNNVALLMTVLIAFVAGGSAYFLYLIM